MSAATLTDEQLDAAYRAVAHPTWPDLRELKLAAARYKLVEGYAQRRASGAFAVAAQTRADDSAAFQRAAAPPGPPRAAATKLHVPHQPPLRDDHKRAAAGDRDD